VKAQSTGLDRFVSGLCVGASGLAAVIGGGALYFVVVYPYPASYETDGSRPASLEWLAQWTERGFDWIPLLAAIGIAVAAWVLLVRRPAASSSRRGAVLALALAGFALLAHFQLESAFQATGTVFELL